MARNRQRAKERQARRRAQQGDGERSQREAPAESDAEPPVTPDAEGRPEPPPAPEPATQDPAVSQRPAPERDNGRDKRREQAERDERREQAEREELDRQAEQEKLREQAELEVGAPPQNLGRSDEVLEDEPDLDEEHFDPAEDMPEEDLVAASGPTGRRGTGAAEHKDRPRFVQFLFAVRAELARVQWPNRQALTTLTGVVLGFVLIAGGYLGLLDAIFSRLIQAIL